MYNPRKTRPSGEWWALGKLGAFTMEHVAAGAHFSTPWILNLRNSQTIEPATKWTAVSLPSTSTRYSFSQLSGFGRALRRTGVRARPNEHSQRTGPPSIVDQFLRLKKQLARARFEPGTSRSQCIIAYTPEFPFPFHRLGTDIGVFLLLVQFRKETLELSFQWFVTAFADAVTEYKNANRYLTTLWLQAFEYILLKSNSSYCQACQNVPIVWSFITVERHAKWRTEFD